MAHFQKFAGSLFCFPLYMERFLEAIEHQQILHFQMQIANYLQDTLHHKIACQIFALTSSTSWKY